MITDNDTEAFAEELLGGEWRLAIEGESRHWTQRITKYAESSTLADLEKSGLKPNEYTISDVDNIRLVKVFEAALMRLYLVRQEQIEQLAATADPNMVATETFGGTWSPTTRYNDKPCRITQMPLNTAMVLGKMLEQLKMPKEWGSKPYDEGKADFYISDKLLKTIAADEGYSKRLRGEFPSIAQRIEGEALWFELTGVLLEFDGKNYISAFPISSDQGQLCDILLPDEWGFVNERYPAYTRRNQRMADYTKHIGIELNIHSLSNKNIDYILDEAEKKEIQVMIPTNALLSFCKAHQGMAALSELTQCDWTLNKGTGLFESAPLKGKIRIEMHRLLESNWYDMENAQERKSAQGVVFELDHRQVSEILAKGKPDLALEGQLDALFELTKCSWALDEDTGFFESEPLSGKKLSEILDDFDSYDMGEVQQSKVNRKVVLMLTQEQVALMLKYDGPEFAPKEPDAMIRSTERTGTITDGPKKAI